MFVTALLIQRETGGNLAEIMTNLSTLMRERAAIRGQIDVLTAEPRMSALVLTGLPVVIFLIVNVMNPDYVLPLYTTSTGRLMLVFSVVSTAIGYMVLKRIGTIEV
jgi:tight adherence protein B